MASTIPPMIAQHGLKTVGRGGAPSCDRFLPEETRLFLHAGAARRAGTRLALP
jgi:hypothetical protein